MFYSTQMDREVSDCPTRHWGVSAVVVLALLLVLFHAIVPDGLPLTKSRGSAFSPANSSVALRGDMARDRDFTVVSHKPRPDPHQNLVLEFLFASQFPHFSLGLLSAPGFSFASLMFDPPNPRCYSLFCPRAPPSVSASR